VDENEFFNISWGLVVGGVVEIIDDKSRVLLRKSLDKGLPLSRTFTRSF